MELKGKTAIVTGAARGIGRAICMELAARGANVVAADVLADPLKSTVSELLEKGVRAVDRIVDVTDAEGVRRLGESVVEEFGGIDRTRRAECQGRK